jgi:DNA-binding transcriptional regulator YiaG
LGKSILAESAESHRKSYNVRCCYYRCKGDKIMTFKELRQASCMTQKEFSEYFGIPKRTIENWETEDRKCNDYIIDLMEYKLKNEGIIK